jgi:hypothetical protein
MFSFDLPKSAALMVALPTGGHAIFVHVGGGRFVSKVPPIVLAGVAREPSAQVEGLPVAWDGETLPGDAEAHPTAFVFDVGSAQAAVERAAAGGDKYAQLVLDELQAAQKTLDAREALGIKDSEPVDAAAADGVGSGA